jgi:hypothetical protein
MATLEQLASEMTQEYTVRRRMLIERAKVCRPGNSPLPCSPARRRFATPMHALGCRAHGVVHIRQGLTAWELARQVLLHSFMWAERLKDQEAAAGAKAVGEKYTAAMQAEPAVSLAQVFQTRQGASPLLTASERPLLCACLQEAAVAKCRSYMACWSFCTGAERCNAEVCRLSCAAHGRRGPHVHQQQGHQRQRQQL